MAVPRLASSVTIRALAAVRFAWNPVIVVVDKLAAVLAIFPAKFAEIQLNTFPEKFV